MLEILWIREGAVGIVAIAAGFLYPPSGGGVAPARTRRAEFGVYDPAVN